jgi:diaminopimelate epimerase
MHVTNSDGSIAEMCGNGLRCVVRYAIDRSLLPSTGGAVETGRGVLTSVVESDGGIRVDMGAAVLEPERIPVRLPGPRVISVPLEVAGELLQITAVSMGNPHAVVFLGDGQDPLAWAERVGPSLEKHSAFPNRTNAELAHIHTPGEIDLVVWERGAGLTQACGTGACATVVAAILNDRARFEETWTVRLPGGPLRIRVDRNFERVWMTGPAVEVFRGEV